MIRRTGAAARSHLSCALVAMLLAIACQASPPSAGAPPERAPAPRRAASAASDAPICVETDAHAKHRLMGYGCSTCHACGGTLLLCGLAFPGGTTTGDMQVVKSGSDTTCSGGCHAPLGAAATPVAWNHGSLGCADCHAALAPGTESVRSSHVAGGACEGCHDQQRHTSGQVVLKSPGGTVDAACIACHSGQGATLAGETPPLLVGWTDTVYGDFHGARLGTCSIDRYWYTSGTKKYYLTQTYQPCGSAGPDDVNVVPTGFGGTLKGPYVRNQGPLPCEACHDAHTSANAYLFAATVNGTPVPAGAIDRAGVGAQALCTACHEGDRHAYCKSCHRAAMITDLEGYTYFDPASPAVDPMPDGSPCFACHGHEGLQLMRVAAPVYPSSHPYGGGDCSHCHGGWAVGALEYAAPLISQGKWSYVPPSTTYYQANYPLQPSPAVWLVPGGTVFGVTETSASIYWETNERATTVVEYGVGTAGQVIAYSPFVAGSVDPANPPGWNTSHRVDLTGLLPNTTYVWRVRTRDAFRNETHTALGTFRTVDPGGPPAPALVHEPDQYNSGGTGNDPWVWWTGQPLQWSQVTAPSGGAVQYRLQLSTDPTFTLSEVDTVTGDTSYPLALSGPLGSYVLWSWRVMAIDPSTGRASIWSSVDAYGVGVGDPYNDY